MPKNIALVCLTNIGDGVLLSPCISALTENRPDLNIVLVAKPSVCELYGHDIRIKNFVPFTCSWFPGPEGLHDGLQGFYLTIATLRSLRCKVAFNTASDLRTNLLLRLAGVHHLMSAFGRGGNFLSTTIHAPNIVSQHEAERQIELAEAFLSKKVGHYPLRIILGEDDINAGNSLFYECAVDKVPVIAMHPGANVPFKEWPVARYVDVAKNLIKERGYTVAVLGALGRETEIANKVVKEIGPGAVNLAGRTPVRTLLAFLGRCEIYIGNDSGPMHLAAAAGCPTIALFGATNFQRFGPYMEDHKRKIVVSNKFQLDTVDCARSYGSDYMATISTEMVLEATQTLLNSCADQRAN